MRHVVLVFCIRHKLPSLLVRLRRSDEGPSVGYAQAAEFAKLSPFPTAAFRVDCGERRE